MAGMKSPGHLLAGLVLMLAASRVRADNGVPSFDHVVIVIEENHASSQIIGSASAPYINSLAANGALMTQSFGITHPSQGNYIALFSGATQGVTDDSVYPHSQFTAPNLGAKLLASGLSFLGYSETMPSVGYDGAKFGSAPATYQRKHNPWVNWQDATVPLPANKLPASVNVPYAGFFPAAANFDTLPTLSFVIPNQLNDMHDGSVAQGDSWLQANLGAYADWCGAHNSLLIVTWDEDNGSAGNQIATIFHGACVIPGAYAQTINHYSVLRTLEDMYGLPHDAGSATASTITSIWDAACLVFTDLGSGLAGAAGIPKLSGIGSLAVGSSNSLVLTSAATSSQALLFASVTSVPVPFKGGTLLAFPFTLAVNLGTDASGGVALPFTWPSAVPAATTLFFQAAVQDAAAVKGVSLSNALEAVTP